MKFFINLLMVFLLCAAVGIASSSCTGAEEKTGSGANQEGVEGEAIGENSEAIDGNQEKVRRDLLSVESLMLDGAYDKAMAELEKVLSIDPDNAEAYHKKGWMFLLQEDFEKAIENLSMAIEKDPDYVEAYYQRSFIYQVLGDMEKAFSDASKAIEIAPEFSDAYLIRALANLAMQDNTAAEADLIAATKYEPISKATWETAYYKLGALALGQDQFDKAIEYLDKGLEINPLNFEINLYKAVAYNKQEKWDLALESYDMALKSLTEENNGHKATSASYIHRSNRDRDRMLATVYNNKCDAYMNKGEYDKAHRECDEAIRVAPDVFFGYLTRGQLFVKMHSYEKALADLDKAIEINPDRASAYKSRGEAYEKLNKPDLAKKDFEMAEELESIILP